MQVEALLLQSEGSARSSPSILPDQGCQQGSIRGKMVPLAPVQELDLDTEPILSYYFRRKSVANPDQVLEKSVQHFRLSVLSSYSKLGSCSDCEQTAISTVIIIIYCPQASRTVWCTAEGKNKQALARRNLQLRFSHSKPREFFYISPLPPKSL